MDEYKGICGARPEGLSPEEIQQPDLTSIYSFDRQTPSLQCATYDTNTAHLMTN